MVTKKYSVQKIVASKKYLEQKNYWLDSLSGELTKVSLTKDFNKISNEDIKYNEKKFDIPNEMVSSINKLCNKSDSRIHMFLLAMISILLNKYSGSNDIIIGTPIYKQEVEGEFTNTILALRTKLDENCTVKDVLTNMRRKIIGAIENQVYPIELLVDELNVEHKKEGFPLFDVMVILENIQDNKYVNDINTNIKFSFNRKEDCIEGKVEYNSELYKESTIKRVISNLNNLIAKSLFNVNEKIEDIDIMSNEEKNRILQEFNNNNVKLIKDKSICEIVEEYALSNPNTIAIKRDEESITYKELNDRANKVAAHLQYAENIKEEDCVGVILERSIDLIVTILGIWKVNAVYIPIGESLPESRIETILLDSGIKTIISHKKYLNKINSLKNTCKFINLTIYMDELDERYVYDKRKMKTDLNKLAYVIYTSGSTGKPKGAMVEHVGMMNHIYAKINELNITKCDVVCQNASQSFDISIWQMFTALVCGGLTVVYSNNAVLNPNKFVSKIIEDKVSILEVVPSYLLVLLELLDETKISLQTLRYLLVTGEVIKKNLIEKWFELYPNIKVVNAYGPTEASDDITHYIMSEIPEMEIIPIGKPVQNFNIYILDKKMNLCPIGVKGEICVSGIGVGRGYLNNVDKTNEVFGIDPFKKEESLRLYKTGDIGRWLSDGNIEFFGRKDYQVKIKGYRIELGDIENKIIGYKGVKEAVVIDKEDENGKKSLWAYLIKNDNVQIDDIRNYLNEQLPSYMVPSYFIVLDRFPLSANGKVDRKLIANLENNNMKYNGIGDDTNKLLNQNININQKLVEGQVELTPIQKEFFENDFKNINQFNQSVVLYKDDGFKEEILKRVISKVIEHHDALRMTYNIQNGSIIQYNRGIDDNMYTLDVININFEDNIEEKISRESNKIQKSINLNKGPLVKLGLFKTIKGDYLLMVIHHLVVDGVSWRIILEDFAQAYKQLEKGEAVQLPPKTHSFKEWAIALKEYAESQEIINEIDYWKQVSLNQFETLPYDNYVDPKERKAKDVQFSNIELSINETEKLLKRVNSAYNTEINDILLTALGSCLKEWGDIERICINLEGHGREEIIKDINIGRTVGWFTSEFPVVFNITSQNDVEDNINNIKTGLRAIPNKGIDYGVIKHLAPKGIELNTIPQIGFNYLGQLDQNNESMDFCEICNMDMGEIINQEIKEKYAIEVNAMISNKKLKVMFSYNKNEYLKANMERLATIFKNNLLNIINHCFNKAKQQSYQGPTNVIERDLVQIWSEVLNTKNLGIEDNFFHVGGDSILAIKLINLINSKLHLNLQVIDLFMNETVSKLSKKINEYGNKNTVIDSKVLKAINEVDNIKNEVLTVLKDTNFEDVYPMSDVQIGMIFYSLKNERFTIETGIAVNHEQMYYQEKYKNFNFDRFKKAMQLMVEKHEILRTSFNIKDFSIPIQIVHKNVELDILHEDISFMNKDQQTTHLNNILLEDRKIPFNYEKAPIWRMRTYDLGNDEIALLWITQQAILDGWSNANFVTELHQTYLELEMNNGYTKEKLRNGYKQFIIEQIIEKGKIDSMRYWKNELKGYKRLNFESLSNNNSEIKARKAYRYTLGEEFFQTIKRVSNEYEVTIKEISFSVYIAMLKMLFSQDDIVIGLITHNRPSCEDGDKILGSYLNMVPVRMIIDDDILWKDFINNVKSKLLELKQYDKMPFYKITKLLNEKLQDNPILDTLFNFIDFHVFNDIDERYINEKYINKLEVNSYSETNTLFDFYADTTFNNFEITMHSSTFDEYIILKCLEYFKRSVYLLDEKKEARLSDIKILDSFTTPEIHIPNMEFNF